MNNQTTELSDQTIELSNQTTELSDQTTALSEENKPKEWLEELFAHIEEFFLYDKAVRCKIFSMVTKGFIVKINGIFAFIPIQLMPWKYPRATFWKVIAPTMVGTSFFCKIKEASRLSAQKFSVYADASVHKFPVVEIVEATLYSAIILLKSPKIIVLDIGYHFAWKCGSIQGILPKTKFVSARAFDACEPGQVIQVYCTGLREEKLDCVEADYYEASQIWNPETMEHYVGKVVPVHVEYVEDKIMLLVDNRYQGQLRKKDYARIEETGLSVVLCKVRTVDYIRRIIILRPAIGAFDEYPQECPLPTPSQSRYGQLNLHTIGQLVDPKMVKRLEALKQLPFPEEIPEDFPQSEQEF